jgi:hypothetical protein
VTTSSSSPSSTKDMSSLSSSILRPGSYAR